MNYLLPSIRYLVPVVAFLLLAQGSWAQAGCTAGDWSYNISDRDGQVPLPPSLGTGSVDYVIVDIFLDGTCSKRFNLSSTIFETDCNIIEYYNDRGNFVGVEDQDIPGSSTFIFNESDLDGTPGTPGRPSGVENGVNGCNLGTTVAPFAYTDGYSPDYACAYTPNGCANGAEANQFYFFRSTPDQNTASNANVAADGYHFLANNPGPHGSYRAVLIRSVRDGSPPVVKGAFANAICVTPVVLNNEPTDLVGDPRGYANSTGINDVLTDNDRTAGIGSDFTAAAFINSNTLTDDATFENTGGGLTGADQVRALICTESTDPYMGGPRRNYGVTDPIGLTGLPFPTGTGYIDADADGDGDGDIDMLDYTNPLDMFNFVAAGATNNTIKNIAPDGCERPVTVVPSDQRDNTQQGYIYGTNSEFQLSDIDATTAGIQISRAYTTMGEVMLAGATSSTTAGVYNLEFGDGGDGRFRKCYSIRRTWTVSDDFNNTTACIQNIDVIDDYEGSACVPGGAGPMVEVRAVGSPHFLDVTVSGNTVEVTPGPDDMLTCASGEHSAASTTIEHQNIYERSGYPTLHKYRNPISSFPANIVAPSFAEGTVATGTQNGLATDADAGTEPRQHYNFPVFVYEDNPDVFACTDIATLDGFLPVASDSCEVQIPIEIETLYDYGGDGDFGDIGVNPIISTSVACPFFDNNVGVYFNNWRIQYALGNDNDQATNNTAGAVTYMKNDDDASLISPDDCKFYEYDILKRWVVEDNCGFRSIAQRIYHISDVEAPDLMASTVTISGSTLNYTPDFTGTTAVGVMPNVKTYELSNTLVLPFSCAPSLFINTSYQDACAANQYIDVQYNIEEFNSTANVYIPVSSGNIYNATTGVTGLLPNRTYRITFQYFDPCGNRTDFAIPVQTLTSATNACPTTAFDVDFNTNPSGVATMLNIFGLTNITSILSSSCTPITDVEFQLTTSSPTAVIFGGVTAVGSSTISTSGDASGCLGAAGATTISNAANLPSIDFNCIDIGTNPTVTLNIYDCSSGTATLFTSCTRPINVFTTATLNVITTPQDASAAGAFDGQIGLNITSPGGVTESYDVSWNGGGISNSVSGVPSGYTIPSLPVGTYSIDVVGNSTCASTTVSATVGTSTPLQLQYSCPTAVTAGQSVVVGIAPTANFNALDFIGFGIQLSGTAGASITQVDAAGTFTPALISGTNYFFCSPSVVNVAWNDNTGVGQNLTAAVDFITIEISVPASAAVGSTISLSLVNPLDCTSLTTAGSASATQTTGAGTGQPVTLLLPTGACAFNVTAPSTGNLSVSGGVVYMNTGTGVSNTTVNFMNMTSGASASSLTSTTPSTYAFTGITVGDAVQVCPTKTGLARPAVNQMDLLDLDLFLAGAPSSIHNVTHPYQLVAADVNQDGLVNGLDVIMIRQHLLFTTTIDDWVFFEASQSIPFSVSLPSLNTCYNNPNYTATDNNVDFIGVKRGDVDESLAVSLLTGGNAVEVRSMNSFIINDQAFNKGEEVLVTFRAKDFKNIMTYQANIFFQDDYLSFEGLDTDGVLPRLDESFFGLSEVAEGNIFTMWNGLEKKTAENGDKLFSLRFKALKSSNTLKGILGLRSDRMRSEIYNSNAEVSNLQLEFVSANKEFVLYPSVPNPFADVTKISFDLPKATTVDLTITDLTGKVVYRRSAAVDKGYNEFWVARTDLPSNGLYYYNIQAADYEVTDKIVLMY